MLSIRLRRTPIGDGNGSSLRLKCLKWGNESGRKSLQSGSRSRLWLTWLRGASSNSSSNQTLTLTHQTALSRMHYELLHEPNAVNKS